MTASILRRIASATIVFLCAPTCVEGGGAAKDLYPYLHGGTFSGRAVAASPDPLVRYQWQPDTVNSSVLQNFYVAPAALIAVTSPSAFLNLESLLEGGAGLATVLGSGTIMLDFGQENAGWLEFDSPDAPHIVQANITMGISEYDQPAVVNSGPQHPNKTAPAIVYASSNLTTYRLELNADLYEGVRFGWIHIQQSEGTEPWHISAVRLVCQVKPQNYQGSFHSSDSELERIWWTAAYTVKLNLMSDYFGSELMDRGDRFSWTGDAHTSQAAAFVAFGNTDFVLNNLNRTSCPTCSNNIASYSLYWVLSLNDFFMQTGNVTVLKNFARIAAQKLDVAIAAFGTDPSLGFFGGDERLGDYFEDPNCPESQRAYSMLTIRACADFAAVCTSSGDPYLLSIASKYMHSKAELTARFKAAAPTPWWQDFGMHAAAEAINAGITSNSETEAIVAKLFSNPVTIVSFTPFNQYFIVDALFRANRTDLAMLAIRKTWGGQLDLGATSFWETFSDQWLGLIKRSRQPSQVAQGPGVVPNGQNGYTSLCHPWAGGVAALLSKYVLGIRPLSPGFGTWQVLPFVPGDLRWMTGEHPCGLVVEFDALAGRLILSNAPRGSVGAVGIPSRQWNGQRWRKLRQIYLGSSIIWDTKSSRLFFERTDDHVLLHGLRGCEIQCSFVAYYSALETTAPDSQVTEIGYPIKFLGADRDTHGEWLGHYGTQGYLLFSFDGMGVDRSSLPAGVKVQVHRGGNPPGTSFISRSEAGMASLQDPKNSSTRALGAVRTENPQACRQDIAIDINGNLGFQKVSLYMADVGNFSRVQIIEVFDLSSKETAGAWQRVDTFPVGVFFSWLMPSTSSVRFRLSYMRADMGMDAMLSAIFFDDAPLSNRFVV